MALRFWQRRAVPPPAQRLYAIGDVHGRLDLLIAMVEAIKADVLARSPASTNVIVLGDFIDRGPDSARAVDLLMRLRVEPRVVVLKGNHEAAMVDALAGDFHALDLWLAHGGLATLASYGVDTAVLDLDDTAQLLRVAREAVPAEVRRWMEQLPSYAAFGRYYFVHAGINPGVPLDQQTDASRLWITDAFTASDEDHGAIVVHGHSINEDGVVIAANRIGVDTGAYRTGRLSAVGLQDGEVWIITATAPPHPLAAAAA
ncbi:metallophosphoesterase family protein [Sphingomonas sp.]|uniref:metallophosphoesterase family protein n=1 Tax=Sphingomonas sp. TaxID=28214 RepID=UPI003CC54E3D